MSDLLSLRRHFMFDSTLTVVKTDYKSYALIYVCDSYIYRNFEKEVEVSYSNYARLWSRTRDLDKDFMSTASIQNNSAKYSTIKTVLSNDYNYLLYF